MRAEVCTVMGVRLVVDDEMPRDRVALVNETGRGMALDLRSGEIAPTLLTTPRQPLYGPTDDTTGCSVGGTVK